MPLGGDVSARGLKSDNYRPCFSGHETFPLRYGWLQKAYEAVVDADSPKEAVHVFRDPESIARFGVGRNMVGSIRYWATAVGILTETDEGLEVSWLGDMLFGETGTDSYLEEDASLWLLHWHLAGRARLTSAYWLFNEFQGGSFVRHDIIAALLKLAQDQAWSRVAPTTVDRDLQCLLRTYIGGRGSSEAGESILAELGLVRPMDRHRSQLSRGRKPSLPDCVFVFCLNDFWNEFSMNQNTMSFENATYAPGSPGRVFLLDEEDIVERLERLEQTSAGDVVWSETAGLRQIIRKGARPQEEQRAILRKSLTKDDLSKAA